jgi:hypothetical protein
MCCDSGAYRDTRDEFDGLRVNREINHLIRLLHCAQTSATVANSFSLEVELIQFQFGMGTDSVYKDRSQSVLRAESARDRLHSRISSYSLSRL